MWTPARQHRVLLLLSLFLLVALAACAPGSGQTSSSRGTVPLGSGANPEPGTDGSAQPLPNGHNESMVATADLAFVGSDNQQLYAIGTTDGQVHWHDKIGAAVLVYAVANGVVYATADTMLYAFNAADGSLVWKYQSRVQLAQVLVSDGVVYANTVAEGNTSTLMVFDAATGAPRWQFATPALTPSLMGVSDGTVYELQWTGDPGSPDAQQTIHALRASDGHALWQATVPATDGMLSGAPAAANGIVYFATTYGSLFAFDATTGHLLWQEQQTSNGLPFLPGSPFPILSNGLLYVGNMQEIAAYRASDGAHQWQYTWANPTPFPSQPTLADGVIYAGSTSGQIVALRASDGTLIWQQHQQAGTEPLVVSDGLVINDSGPVFALRASDGALVWQSSANPSGESTPAGKPELVNAGAVYIGGDDGTVTALQVSDGKQLWHYAIQELPVQLPPVYVAAVTFASNESYQQALEILTNLGLKTFVQCHAQSWTSEDEKASFAQGYAMTVASTVNSAPLWLGRLKATPGVTAVQAMSGVMSCPAMRPDNGPKYLPEDQAGGYVRVTFTSATAYASALDSLNALGFRLANPCYEQARAQGKKPTWGPMSEADAFTQSHALVLATTLYNAITWASQVKGVFGMVSVDTSYKATC